MSSYAYTNSQTFTITHAKQLAAKVATDLKRIQRLYNGGPNDDWISQYEEEVSQLLKYGYLNTVTYGFKRNDKWIIPTIKYTADELYAGNTDDDPGRVPVGADITGAYFTSFLTYSSKWFELTYDEREKFKEGLPFKRGHGNEPAADGYFSSDKTYSSGGKSINRSTLK